MPRFFCMINGTPRNVRNMKFHVDAEECAIVGTWHAGKPWQPNRAQFRAALPARWRPAFDRESHFWHDSVAGSVKKGQCRISLSDRRGLYLATIYCSIAEES